MFGSRRARFKQDALCEAAWTRFALFTFCISHLKLSAPALGGALALIDHGDLLSTPAPDCALLFHRHVSFATQAGPSQAHPCGRERAATIALLDAGATSRELACRTR